MAAPAPLAAVEITRKVIVEREKPGLAAHLRAFPGVEVERDRTPSRDVDL